MLKIQIFLTVGCCCVVSCTGLRTGGVREEEELRREGGGVREDDFRCGGVREDDFRCGVVCEEAEFWRSGGGGVIRGGESDCLCL